MFIGKKEKIDFLNDVNQFLNSNAFDGRGGTIHLTREDKDKVRLTLYYNSMPVSKKIIVSSKTSVKKLGKLISKEYPRTFKHVKQRKSHWESVSIY